MVKEKLPRSTMITKRLIISAYVDGNHWAKRRIEEFKKDSRYKKPTPLLPVAA